MKNLKIYLHEKCGTCRKAAQFLNSRGVEYDSVPIREQPPTKMELRFMLGQQGNNVKKLFNTSGLDYKSMNIKDKLPVMTAGEAIDLLSVNGRLVKRPFALIGDRGLLGFKESEWTEALKKASA